MFYLYMMFIYKISYFIYLYTHIYMYNYMKRTFLKFNVAVNQVKKN